VKIDTLPAAGFMLDVTIVRAGFTQTVWGLHKRKRRLATAICVQLAKLRESKHLVMLSQSEAIV